MGSASIMRCPTVAIVNPASPHGFIVINESDLKPHHTLWIAGMSDKLKVIPEVLEAPADILERVEIASRAEAMDDARARADEATEAAMNDPIGELAGHQLKAKLDERAPTDAIEPVSGMDVPSNGELAVHGASLRVSRGPRGKFYVKKGKEHVDGPFETEEKAGDALYNRMTGFLAKTIGS